ncbi:MULTISPECIES: RICIN domain-containing protein [Nocardiopsis]|uniref:RICIN domain-containing protein n=1 Tax=Nocardiopsis TaxID=2013 RepID=UPI00034BB8DE|nr:MULTISPECIES: RICIN domain-containing protein [Nocardiopsis]
MSLIQPGEYFIRCAENDLYIDLSGGNADPETPVIGWHLHKGTNQRWDVQLKSAPNVFTVRSMVGEVYVGLSSLKIFPPLVAAQSFPEPWSIEPVGEGKFRIHFLYMDAVVTLPEDREGTQLVLRPWRGENRQMFVFENA